MLENQNQMRTTFVKEEALQDNALAQKVAARKQKQIENQNKPESASPPSGPPPQVNHY